MKKILLKTAFITLGVAIVLAIAAFGIVSLAAPKAMMKFTGSLGLDTLSGDYAFQEYERSGDIDCLARSFLLAAEGGNYNSANDRFEKLREEGDRFEEYCETVPVPEEDGVPAYLYRDYVMGRAACVKYALGQTDEAVSLAIAETDVTFRKGNPVVALIAAVSYERDLSTCALIEDALKEETKFEESDYYNHILILLEEMQTRGESSSYFDDFAAFLEEIQWREVYE